MSAVKDIAFEALLLKAVKKLLKELGINEEKITVYIILDDELKGSYSVKIKAESIDSIEEAIKKTYQLNENLSKMFPDKYITVSVIPS
ncbi:hypothetical protein [Persephonella sp.]